MLIAKQMRHPLFCCIGMVKTLFEEFNEMGACGREGMFF